MSLLAPLTTSFARATGGPPPRRAAPVRAAVARPLRSSSRRSSSSSPGARAIAGGAVPTASSAWFGRRAGVVVRVTTQPGGGGNAKSSADDAAESSAPQAGAKGNVVSAPAMKRRGDPSSPAESTGTFDEAKARAAFDKFDDDGSGALEAPELVAVLNELGLAGASDEDFAAYATTLMAEYDRDESGEIDFEEFSALYRECLADASKRSQCADNLKAARERSLTAGFDAHAAARSKEREEERERAREKSRAEALAKSEAEFKARADAKAAKAKKVEEKRLAAIAAKQAKKTGDAVKQVESAAEKVEKAAKKVEAAVEAEAAAEAKAEAEAKAQAEAAEAEAKAAAEAKAEAAAAEAAAEAVAAAEAEAERLAAEAKAEAERLAAEASASEASAASDAAFARRLARAIRTVAFDASWFTGDAFIREEDVAPAETLSAASASPPPSSSSSSSSSAASEADADAIAPVSADVAASRLADARAAFASAPPADLSAFDDEAEDKRTYELEAAAELRPHEDEESAGGPSAATLVAASGVAAAGLFALAGSYAAGAASASLATEPLLALFGSMVAYGALRAVDKPEAQKSVAMSVARDAEAEARGYVAEAAEARVKADAKTRFEIDPDAVVRDPPTGAAPKTSEDLARAAEEMRAMAKAREMRAKMYAEYQRSKATEEEAGTAITSRGGDRVDGAKNAKNPVAAFAAFFLRILAAPFAFVRFLVGLVLGAVSGGKSKTA